jgi:hypothetical protein
MEKKTVKQHNPRDQDQDKAAENTGDNRTPEKTIGEIKYAEDQDKKPVEGSREELSQLSLRLFDAGQNRKAFSGCAGRRPASLYTSPRTQGWA